MLSYRLFITISLVLLVAISFTSCLEGSTGPQGPPGECVSTEKDTILGIWELYYKFSSYPYRLVLRENGTYFNGNHSGTYSVDGNILSLIYNEKQSDYEYLLSGNRLSIRITDSTRYADYIRVSY